MKLQLHLEKPKQRNEGVFTLRVETTDMELATAQQRHSGAMTALPEATSNIPYRRGRVANTANLKRATIKQSDKQTVYVIVPNLCPTVFWRIQMNRNTIKETSDSQPLHQNEKTTYMVNGKRFVVTPVFDEAKGESFTNILFRLLQSEIVMQKP